MSELTCFSSKVLFSILHPSNLQVTFHEIARNKFSTSTMFLPIMLLSSHLLLWFLSATSLGKSYFLFSRVYCFCSYFFFLSIFRFLFFQRDCFLPLHEFLMVSFTWSLISAILLLFPSLCPGSCPQLCLMFPPPSLQGGVISRVILWDWDGHKFDTRLSPFNSLLTLVSHFPSSQSLGFYIWNVGYWYLKCRVVLRIKWDLKGSTSPRTWYITGMPRISNSLIP